MARSLNVLVLGVGGNVSQGILKALRCSSLDCRVVGACVNPWSAGLYLVETAYLSPYASDPAFLDWLIETCKRERIDAILSGVEQVLDVLAPHKEWIREQTGAIAIVSDPARLAIGADKLLTARWLERNGFHSARSAAGGDAEEVAALVRACGFPLIAKPRSGKGSEGVARVDGPEALARFSSRPGYVIQEHVGSPDAEYTAACFCDIEGSVRGAIVLRRSLAAGTTYVAEAGLYPQVRAEATRIAAALRPLGPCNIQMRLAGERAVCFEINVRFSGTCAIRAHFGFNDVEASLRHFVLGEPAVDMPAITSGIALRYWNEVYVNPEVQRELSASLRLDAHGRTRSLVDSYGMER